ncbi:polyphosphate polymerase domain-containing protein [Microbacterium sp. KUDC0406]|uniref:polyphosphate polymerase domain-containing protein n=1 Tax=Microbacterium sp. KUDC0406 TaxID=2909588 RepID=UPI001F1C07AA|nr:polyphosphate polymerase domain-containing protein [Microbacterium sp. KUDC0406]UJP10821.1 polyphosphate polymerase domain-containing protein [Microbacterium sp. KUDC0406]
MTSPAAVLDALPSISLSELESAAALMNRVDRKYFVPRALLGRLLPDAGEGLRTLEIGGLRSFRYRSVYLDTPRFALYCQHAQGRRHRFKVRTRTYRDSGGCQLEVKSKGLRGLTVKQRIPHDPARAGRLGADGRRFVSAVTGTDAAELNPVLRTDYRRSTLVQGDHRITIDEQLDFSTAGRRIAGPDDLLVETKSAGGASELDRLFVQHGVRPHRVSKYCLAASLLYPQLRGNDWSRVRRRYWPEQA